MNEEREKKTEEGARNGESDAVHRLWEAFKKQHSGKQNKVASSGTDWVTQQHTITACAHVSATSAFFRVMCVFVCWAQYLCLCVFFSFPFTVPLYQRP